VLGSQRVFSGEQCPESIDHDVDGGWLLQSRRPLAARSAEAGVPHMSPVATEAGDDARLLAETFIHIAGIGPKTERRLWRAGIASWDELRTTSFGLRADVLQALEDSAEALATDDVDFFFSALPARERWRAFSDFGSRFAAVDIETTGMSIYDQITVVGIEFEGQYRTFIAGSNLHEAAELIASASGLITFNGALFDLPFIQRTFPDLQLPPAHVDLRFLARRVGWAGSLKAVEQRAELRRSEELADLSGYGATVLWSQFDGDGDLDALERLVVYNAADTCVLRPLAELVTERLRNDLYTDRGDDADAAPTLFAQVVRPRRSASSSGPRELPPLPDIVRSPAGLRVGAVEVTVPPLRGLEPDITLAALRRQMPDADARIVGIDLTGSEARPTGWALLQGDVAVTGLVHTDEELLRQTLACKPRIVSIDSPLSIPVGRHCTDDACSCRVDGGITRHCERELKRRGINVYPCLIQSMQNLTRRGMRLAAALREAGVEVIESYPGAAQDIMRIPRKRASQERLRAGLARFGVCGLRRSDAITHDELDAVTSAVVGAFFLADAFEGIGNPDEGYLIVPRVIEALRPTPRNRATARLPVLVIVGEEARGVLERVRGQRPSASTDVVHAAATPEEFFSILAEDGPHVRGFYVAPPGTRLKRRPSLFDAHRRFDAPDIDEALARWLAEWEPTGCP
jgi:uncharacterized protein YprB with RNaseH-like and TPR domain/predicted nuclease with RNAse H fold